MSPLFGPVIALGWKISDPWNLDGLFPIYGKLHYKAFEKIVTGASHFRLITSYALPSPAFSGEYFKRTRIDLLLVGRWESYAKFFVEGRLGYALDRNYAQFSGND